MYRPGHYGAALLAYAPLGFALLSFDLPGLAVLGGALSLALAPVPDLDQRIPLIRHRGVTHTLLFALVVGGVLGAVGWVAGTGAGVETARRLAAFGGVVGTVAILSHLLADVITPMGITPFWPLSRRNYTLRLARADNAIANYLLLALGVFAVALVVSVSRPALPPA
ncbi:metal-dependent hydrolase [Haloarcula nitratireducens]|uniref:Metal-dependent hydrolase n=1 Tax=Haloarcula nitratireducens TaxID=2487749 RepID=A0AAW4P7U0_9EURY|nr:metal-dependent hydrolase [Halomicroarcula nitratireducens]MBX0293954.1 metal-dependent hydrolase [Halomicroarcula nitratireducens]